MAKKKATPAVEETVVETPVIENIVETNEIPETSNEETEEKSSEEVVEETVVETPVTENVVETTESSEVVDESTKAKTVTEEKTDETLQEMNKITDKALGDIDVEDVETVTTEDENTPKVEDENTPKVEDENEPTVETELNSEEVTDAVSEVRQLLREENLFNYVSFGRHLTHDLTDNEIKAFSEEFLSSGMMSTRNHYRLAELLKGLFPKK